LQYLRERGVLIIGSGNLVHNLRLIDWKKMHEPKYGFDWALEARAIIYKHILEGNHAALKNYHQLGKSVSLAVPSPDHYLPLLYTLSLKRDHEQVSLFNDKAVMGSISMTSVLIG
jgi:4,5-DOPA dioxygenase extradiol